MWARQKMLAWTGVVLASIGLLACSSVQRVESFTPGKVTIEQVRAREKPAAEWRNPDGTLTLEYDARLYTEQNLMFDFDDKGVLSAIREVLTEDSMELLRMAMTRSEVKRILGNPRVVSKDGLTGGEIWEWPLGLGSDGMAQRQILVLFHPVADGVVRIEKSIRFH